LYPEQEQQINIATPKFSIDDKVTITKKKYFEKGIHPNGLRKFLPFQK